MKKLAFALAVAMLLTCFGCAAGETTGESTAGTTSDTTTSATTTATTTKVTVPEWVSFDEAAVGDMLFAFLDTGSFGDKVLEIDTADFFKDFRAFTQKSEAGEAGAVIVRDDTGLAVKAYYIAYLDGKYIFATGSRDADGSFALFRGEDGMAGYVSEYRYLLTKESPDVINFRLSNSEKWEDGMVLFFCQNPLCVTVDESIDVRTIPTVTNDYEQVKALLYAYGDGSNLPENFPPVYTKEDGSAFLQFYEKAMAGTECAAVRRAVSEDGSVTLEYVAFTDGRYYVVAVAFSYGSEGIYRPSEWKHLIKYEEDWSAFKAVYLLINDNTLTYREILDGGPSGSHDGIVQTVILYSVARP